jgi:hypothetical protein
MRDTSGHAPDDVTPTLKARFLPEAYFFYVLKLFIGNGHSLRGLSQ